jgi:hypothetical protein
MTRSSLPGSARAPRPDRSVTIRRATWADARAIERVAQLDSRRAPEGDVLVAEVDGEVIAAKQLGARETIADPFRPTESVVRLLEIRAEQMRAADSVRADALPRRGLRRALRAW